MLEPAGENENTPARSARAWAYRRKSANTCRFFHPDYYRWYGNFTHSAGFRRVADFTASEDLHLALKQTFFVIYYSTLRAIVKCI